MVVWTDKALEHITEFIDGVREDLYCLFNVIIFLLYLISKFLRILFRISCLFLFFKSRL